MTKTGKIEKTVDKSGKIYYNNMYSKGAVG